jgi:hypothetical protein
VKYWNLFLHCVAHHVGSTAQTPGRLAVPEDDHLICPVDDDLPGRKEGFLSWSSKIYGVAFCRSCRQAVEMGSARAVAEGF